MTDVSEENYLMHYGILRRSGRYPWGSGSNVETRSKSFIDIVKNLMSKGWTTKQIADSFSTEDQPFTVKDLRDHTTMARAYAKASDVSMAQRMAERGNSPKAISERMGIPEPTIRNYLKPGADAKAKELFTLRDYIKDRVETDDIIDIGLGVAEKHGITPERLSAGIAMLKDEGYMVHDVYIPQSGRQTMTRYKVLTKPGTTRKDAWELRDKISQLHGFSSDGRDFVPIQPPISISSKRLQVKYADDGGAEADGTIYVRPGAKDLSMGGKPYAQVRIMIDGSHYIKGMAVIKDDLPPGVDLVFHTPKDRTASKLDALKPLDESPISPFKSVVRQQIEFDSNGNPKVTSAINIVGSKDGSGAEGAWADWSKTLPSQFLSKQTPALIKEQLTKTQEQRLEDFDKINSLTNPSIKKKLLESFADDTDSSAVHMKAVAMKGQATHVILPVPQMKDNEVYAPNYDSGTRVVLVRFPHAGRFEIPELTVNNNNPSAKKLLGNAADAIGINAKVAERLSGADFDGDAVLVIPNTGRKVKTMEAIVKDFDTKRNYPPVDGMKTIDGGVYDAKTGKVTYKGSPNKKLPQTEMGKISNLITDMSVRGADPDELARAAKHSMVIIDSEKHHLNYKESYRVNNIKDLTDRYQKPFTETNRAGASTLLSRSTKDMEIEERKPRTYRTHPDGPVDPATGKRMYEPTGRIDKRTGQPATMKVEKGFFYDDPYSLTSGGSKANPGTVVEGLYANHSATLKALANQSRLVAARTKPTPYVEAAAKAYRPELDSLVAKIRVAKANAPLERQAQVLQKVLYKARTEDGPFLDKEQQRKLTYQTLKEARSRVGADKADIKITDAEWNAIQSGAVSPNRMNQILRYTNVEELKQRALPRPTKLMSATNITRAKALAANGATQAEIARALGVSLTTLKDGLSS